jgi:uncharacterized membrane protein YraQ (UPF0718 family)
VTVVLDRAVFFLSLIAELSVLFLAVSTATALLTQGLSPARIRALLGGRHPVGGMLMAALLGAVTPFCSCGTVPFAAGMLRAGVAAPVLATFIVMSPLVSPAAVSLFATLVSPTYALLFVLASLAASLAVGALVSLVGLTPAAMDLAENAEEKALGNWGERIERAFRKSWKDYRKLLPIFLVAGLVASLLHNNVASEWIAGALDGEGWWMVPLAAIVGVPVYASTAVLLPLGGLLYAGGVNLGVVTAFVMGATGFSVPEGIMLNRLLGPRLLAVVAGGFTLSVMLIGYAFQALA